MSGDDTRELVARLREMADWCRESVVYGKAAVCDDAASRLEELEAWREAIIDAAVVNWTYRAEHDTNPRAAVHDLLALVGAMALDPAVSLDAKRLHDRAEQAEAQNARLRAALEQLRDLALQCERTTRGGQHAGTPKLYPPSTARLVREWCEGALAGENTDD